MHTPLDTSALSTIADPNGVQPRERPVPCRWCAKPTWNLTATCDKHYEPPALAADHPARRR